MRGLGRTFAVIHHLNESCHFSPPKMDDFFSPTDALKYDDAKMLLNVFLERVQRNQSVRVCVFGGGPWLKSAVAQVTMATGRQTRRDSNVLFFGRFCYFHQILIFYDRLVAEW